MGFRIRSCRESEEVRLREPREGEQIGDSLQEREVGMESKEVRRTLEAGSNYFLCVASNDTSNDTLEVSASRGPEMAIRAVIVDDEPLARKRIHDLLREDEEIEIVGECGNGSHALELLEREKPDLLFLD